MWIYGREKTITKIPIATVDSILNDAVIKNKVTDDERKYIEDDIKEIKNLWRFKNEDCHRKIISFVVNLTLIG